MWDPHAVSKKPLAIKAGIIFQRVILNILISFLIFNSGKETGTSLCLLKHWARGKPSESDALLSLNIRQLRYQAVDIISQLANIVIYVVCGDRAQNFSRKTIDE